MKTETILLAGAAAVGVWYLTRNKTPAVPVYVPTGNVGVNFGSGLVTGSSGQYPPVTQAGQPYQGVPLSAYDYAGPLPTPVQSGPVYAPPASSAYSGMYSTPAPTVVAPATPQVASAPAPAPSGGSVPLDPNNVPAFLQPKPTTNVIPAATAYVPAPATQTAAVVTNVPATPGTTSSAQGAANTISNLPSGGLTSVNASRYATYG